MKYILSTIVLALAKKKGLLFGTVPFFLNVKLIISAG